MIQVYTDSFKLSQDFYDDIVFSLPLDQMECSCGESGLLIFYGFYKRSVKYDGTVLVLRIQRVRCRKCGKTHAILLSSLIPYSQISLQDQQQIIYDLSTTGSCSGVMDRNPLIDENNARHILRRFRRYWQERIRSLGLLVTDELVRPCFSHFSRQFMQIRRIPNLFFAFLPTVYADPPDSQCPFQTANIGLPDSYVFFLYTMKNLRRCTMTLYYMSSGSPEWRASCG